MIRFSDFEWLFLELKYKYPGIIIPLLPEKSPFVKINIMNEKSHEFLEMRKKSLAIFLTKILKHNELKYTPEVKKFIEENSQVNIYNYNLNLYNFSNLKSLKKAPKI